MLSFDEQFQREHVADELAARRALEQYADAAASGNIDGLPRAQVLIGRLFADVRERIAVVHTAILDKAQGWGRGRQAMHGRWITRVSPDVLAVMLLHFLIKEALMADRQHSSLTFQRLAKGLGRNIEREALLADAIKVSPLYVKHAFDNLKRSSTKSEGHIQRTSEAIIENVLALDSACQLEDSDLMHIGKVLLQVALSAELVTVHRSTGHKGHMVYYQLAECVQEFLRVRDSDVASFVDPGSLTMLAPPLPWTGIAEGGYYTPRRRLVMPLIKLNRDIYKSGKHSLYSPEAMPAVYAACNYLQSQAFELDAEVVSHLSRLWGQGGGVLGLPKLSLGDKPEFPFPESWTKDSATPVELEAFQLWKERCARHYTAVAKNAGKVLTISSLLRRAKSLEGATLWHPVFLDWRGRIYYRGSPNPQGTDFERAVLHFKDKRALGTRGVYWLKVHMANCLGYDKVPLDQRVRFVEERWDTLVGDSTAPEDSALYRGADSPISLLAAVLELKRAIDSGDPYTYQSGLPVHVDATCSGLQHFSAMLRDPIGGRYVNLTASDVREDIYQHLADLLNSRIAILASKPCASQRFAQIWQAIGITRALAKKPVMTYVYSATALGISDDISEYLLDTEANLDNFAEPGEVIQRRKLCMFLAKLMMETIQEVVPAAAAVMQWLRNLVGKDDEITWTAPNGFTVIQRYYNYDKTRIEVKTCGVEKVVCFKRKDSMNIREMRDGISPNFVHSMDASHLVSTVNASESAGIPIVTIHDSFGTTAGDVDTLLLCTKEQFIKQYSNPNLLVNTLDRHILGVQGAEQKVTSNTDNITIGTLDITSVLHNQYFFS